MKLKVLFLPAWYPSERNPIAGIFVKEHAKAAQLYDEVTVLYAEPGPVQEGIFSFRASVEDDLPTFRFRFPSFNIPKTTTLIYILSVLRAFLILKNKKGFPDVIHAVEPQAAAAAFILNRFFGVPYVVSEHWTAFSKRTLPSHSLTLARLAYPRACRVLGVNKGFPDDFNFYNIRCDFRWLPNCVDTKLFSPPSSNSREPLVLHCSLFDHKKRVPNLIKAFALCQKEFPQAKIELIGDGPQREESEVLARTMLAPGSYFFHGLKPKSAIAKLMKKAKVFVLPSYMETFGIVLIEAMACGTPVIATNVGGVVYIVNNNNGLLVEPDNILSLSKAIKMILSGEIIFDSEDISKYISDNFSMEAVGELLHQEHLRAFRYSNTTC